MPLRTQADLLGLSRGSLYYEPVPPSPEEVAHKHRIDELYTAHPFYGSRRLTVEGAKLAITALPPNKRMHPTAWIGAILQHLHIEKPKPIYQCHRFQTAGDAQGVRRR